MLRSRPDGLLHAIFPQGAIHAPRSARQTHIPGAHGRASRREGLGDLRARPRGRQTRTAFKPAVPRPHAVRPGTRRATRARSSACRPCRDASRPAIACDPAIAAAPAGRAGSRPAQCCGSFCAQNANNADGTLTRWFTVRGARSSPSPVAATKHATHEDQLHASILIAAGRVHVRRAGDRLCSWDRGVVTAFIAVEPANRWC
jgi:hypothetical protein